MTESRARGEVIALTVVLVVASIAAALAFSSLSDATASDVSVPRVQQTTGLPPVNFTLYGSASKGWGFSNGTIAPAGANLTVHVGDLVTLTLIGNDSDRHTWFIDYDNSLAPNGDEPVSPEFNVPVGNVLVWSFIADRPGNWTYRCGVHPISMKGPITVLEEPRPVNWTLYGNAGTGWGFSNATIGKPNPLLVVFWRTNVTLTLIGNDSDWHNWFIDYDNSLAPSAGEPLSGDFNVPVGKVVVWSFIADRSGNWTYRCGVHPTSMKGSILVVGGPPAGPGGGPTIPLTAGMMLGTLGVVLVFAAVYHIRAVRAAKRTK